MLFLALLVQQINAPNLSAWVCSIPLFEEHWSLSTARSCCYASKTIFTSLSFLYNLRFPLPRLLSWVLASPLSFGLVPPLHSEAFALLFSSCPVPSQHPSPCGNSLQVTIVLCLSLVFILSPLPFYKASSSACIGQNPISVSYTVPQHKCTPMIPFLYITVWFHTRVTCKDG